MDSIVKNVGTPYTLFLSRGLYSTFMTAYSLVNGHTRQKLDEMLSTWKHPNAGSRETRPVFPQDVTKPIEDALSRARNAASEQNNRQATPLQQDSVSRHLHATTTHAGHRHTPTPSHVTTRNGGSTLTYATPFGQTTTESQYPQVCRYS